ncbi:MAG: hydrogenase expression/formation protein HypE [Bacteroidales bacterium]|nr:hydrogenase expression/formation protein HypE [Bacteroidales bacterium]
MKETILLGHGSGGKLSHELIKNLFVKYFDNAILKQQTDAALLQLNRTKIAFTTDSYVIDPVFFPGGNIGKLAVCGTVNDISVSGAKPLYISAAFIIEEGFPLTDLEKIVSAMADEAKKAGVLIVTGDTKVVSKGQCDKVFINTAGIGVHEEKYCEIGLGVKIKTGDKIIINGSIADHGMAIMAVRNFGNFEADIKSDCASLNGLIQKILNTGSRINFMRDATRGGMATVLCELAEQLKLGVEIEEFRVPVNENVRGMCELLGFDPFYVANEGKVILVVHPDDAELVLETMKLHELGKDASIIGEIVEAHPSKAILNTGIGGKRIIDMLAGEQLPRIC